MGYEETLIEHVEKDFADHKISVISASPESNIEKIILGMAVDKNDELNVISSDEDIMDNISNTINWAISNPDVHFIMLITGFGLADIKTQDKILSELDWRPKNLDVIIAITNNAFVMTPTVNNASKYTLHNHFEIMMWHNDKNGDPSKSTKTSVKPEGKRQSKLTNPIVCNICMIVAGIIFVLIGTYVGSIHDKYVLKHVSCGNTLHGVMTNHYCDECGEKVTDKDIVMKSKRDICPKCGSKGDILSKYCSKDGELLQQVTMENDFSLLEYTAIDSPAVFVSFIILGVILIIIGFPNILKMEAKK